MACAVLIGQLGYVASISGLVMAVCALNAHISPDCKIGVSVTLLVGENPNRIVAGGGADVAHLKAPVLNHYGVLSVPPGGGTVQGDSAVPLKRQWEASDKVLREDFNADNAKIDAALGSHATQIAQALTTAGNAFSPGKLPVVTGSYVGDETLDFLLKSSFHKGWKSGKRCTFAYT